MTHFTVAIIIPPHIDDIESYIARQMAPYDENSKVEPYVCHSPEKAATELSDTIHRLEMIIARQEEFYDIERCSQHLAELRSTNPEEFYRNGLRFYETFNDRGEPLATCNPDGKWDWYVIGGRWDG